MNKKALVGGAVVFLGAAFVAGALGYKQWRAQELDFLAQKNSEVFVRPHSMIIGATEAKVYLVEFFDPGCESCRMMAGHVKSLMAKHPGRIKLVMRYLPLHHGADQVAKVLEAARRQGLYEKTLALVFETQPIWASHHKPNPAALWQFLPGAGLDMERLAADLKDPKLDALIKQDLDDAKVLGARKTPTFFVNGKPLPQFGREHLTKLVQSEIDRVYEK